MQLDKAVFFRAARAGLLGPKLESGEVQGCEAILDAFSGAGLPLPQLAYALATAFHETAGTMQPIKERGGYNYLENNYGINGRNPQRARAHGHTSVGDGARWAGRGLVQLTWKDNYIKFDRLLGLRGALIANPDLAMRMDIAVRIMLIGMTTGGFTGAKMSTFLKPPHVDYFNARTIINGHDDARLIAGYADKFDLYLQQAQYRP